MAQSLTTIATPKARVFCRDCGARVEAVRARKGLTLCADCGTTAQTIAEQDHAHEFQRQWMSQNGEARLEDVYY